jgi:ABC-2 type transport system ATP-binding protein
MAAPAMPVSPSSPEPQPGRVVVEHLTKTYKGLRAVDDLSFTVEPGRVTGFLGPNGAGKTTTLRMLLGLVTPTSGRATIAGRPYADLPDPTRMVGAVLEASSAHRGRSGLNHLKMVCLASELPLSRAAEALALVGLGPAADRPFKGYSLGMQQRLGIATAMLGDPRVLILDEPANGLDPEGIRWMRMFLRGLAREGRTIVVSSHLLVEMQALADDVVIVAEGRLVKQGSVSEVTGALTAVQDQVVEVRTPHPDRLAPALERVGGQVETLDDRTLRVRGLSEDSVGDTALDIRVPVHRLLAPQADLEAAFLQLTQGKAEIR